MIVLMVVTTIRVCASYVRESIFIFLHAGSKGERSDDMCVLVV